METFTYYYLWVFLFLQIITLLKAYAVFGTPKVSLKKRLFTSLFHIARAAVCVWLGLKLLETLEKGSIGAIWIMSIVAAFSLVDIIAVWTVEHHLLGKHLPTVREFFS